MTATGTFPSLTEGESVPRWNSTLAPLQPEALAGGVGVDRLSVSFPVRRFAEPSRWDRVDYRYGDGQETVAATLRPSDGGPGLMVGVRTGQGGSWGKVECNPSRLWDPAGCSLLPPRMLGAALEVMWAAARELTTPDCAPVEARVKRLDVARDFRGITSPPLYVQGLAPLHRSYARQKGVWHDAQAGGAQTLHVGNKGGGMVRLYDQHAAYAEKGAPEGSLRWEVEARRGWLGEMGVTRVQHLDPVAVERMAAHRWEWSKMGTTVTGPVNAVEVLQRAVAAGEVKQAVADRLLGSMVRRSFGFGQEARTSEWRHRDLAVRLGLTAEALWSDDLSRQASGRLDFETGTEFLALSA